MLYRRHASASRTSRVRASTRRAGGVTKPTTPPPLGTLTGASEATSWRLPRVAPRAEGIAAEPVDGRSHRPSRVILTAGNLVKTLKINALFGFQKNTPRVVRANRRTFGRLLSMDRDACEKAMILLSIRPSRIIRHIGEIAMSCAESLRVDPDVVQCRRGTAFSVSTGWIMRS